MASNTSGVVENVTYTGKNGPAVAVTAQAFNGAKQLLIDVATQTVTIFGSTVGPQPGPMVLDYNPLGTLTATIAAGTLTVTMS